jgi:hypothetical protein
MNVARVALYRVGIKCKLHPVLRIRGEIGGAEFFRLPSETSALKPTKNWDSDAVYFGWYRVPLQGNPPAWFVNPFNQKLLVDAQQIPWWCLSDFGLGVGDIKVIWEPSRFDWVLALAQRAKGGDSQSLERLNAWLADWCGQNPAYYGPNWKCGQEASIRVMHLAMAAVILQQPDMCPDLANFVKAHLKRIYPTVSYAMAQENNHGTSEAAALFIGGSWCEVNGIKDGKKWMQKGRKLLENRVKKLVSPDGSFSQYSVNYHRVFIDTLSMVEVWRKWRKLNDFTPLLYRRVESAINWLYTVVDPEGGDAPNLGGNDGARLLPLTDTGYRDFRPSVQLAMAIFLGRKAYDEGRLDLPLKWLSLSAPTLKANLPDSRQFNSGGYSILRDGNWMAVLKYPRYHFRPRHCDALHVDLWIGSNNFLRDGGSFSYNAGQSWENYFTGTETHNTVEFDKRDQMPRISRFLRGAWLESQDVTFGRKTVDWAYASAGYHDCQKCSHYRLVKLKHGALIVSDQVKGFNRQAVLRWRLRPGNWRIKGNSVVDDRYKLKIKASVAIERFELVQGWESRFYCQKKELPVLEIEIRKPGEIESAFFMEL